MNIQGCRRQGLAIALRLLSSDTLAICSKEALVMEASSVKSNMFCKKRTMCITGYSSRDAWSQRSLGFLSLAAMSGLAASCCLDKAQCEAESSSKGPPGAVGEAEVVKAVNDLWIRLEEQIDRLQASLSSRDTLPRIPEPEVEYSNGEVSIIFRVPQALNAWGAGAAVRQLLAKQPESTSNHGLQGMGFSAASISEECSSGPQGRARRIRRASPTLGSITIDILQPFDTSQPSHVEFRGSPTRSNLDAMSETMLAVVRPRKMDGRLDRDIDGLIRLFGGGRGGTDTWQSSGPLDEGLGSLFAPLRELLEDFDRWGMLEDGGLHDNNPSGGQARPPSSIPRPRHLAKRFDEVDGPEDQPSKTPSGSSGRGPYYSPQVQGAIKKLRDMGAQVFLPPHSTDAPSPTASQEEGDSPAPAHAPAPAPAEIVDWGTLAGYEMQKRAIEDCLLLPLVRPDVYDAVAKGTRRRFASNRPRAVLFVGPPGTGKTSSARVIAEQASVPLVYLPLEALVSKWYGESEKQLAEALAAGDSLPNGCIFFLDELDALATQRGGDMHEATRRLLGVLLRHMDGFDASKRSVVVGATNRPEDLDPALVSRFSATVEFGLPTESCRRAILRQYASHLDETEVGEVAARTPGMAGRDLRDVCEQAERRWASKIIRGKAKEGEHLPPLEEYLEAADARLREMGRGAARHG